MNEDQFILVVDDDPTQTLILSAYLKSIQPRKVVETNSAIEAVNMVKENIGNVGMVVTDLRMPEMDGAEMLRRLKDISYSGHVVIISSLPEDVIEGTKRLARLHGLDVVGSCRKPLSRYTLDATFLSIKAQQEKRSFAKSDALEFEKVRDALQDGKIQPFFQPQVDVYNKKIVGVEALARWFSDDGKMVPPDAFIPTIEENGLTKELTFSILDQTLAALKKWQMVGMELRVAVNITAREITNLDFPDQIAKHLSMHGVKPSELVLEVTESITLDVNATSLEVLSRLRILGVQIAIDDFGTGFSNIKTLRDFPYNELKIDQTFVRSADKDRFSQETVRTAVALGRQLNMRLLAEGVETEKEWQFVRQNGIDEVQGYFIAKPMSADDFMTFYQLHDGLVIVDQEEEISVDRRNTGANK